MKFNGEISEKDGKRDVFARSEVVAQFAGFLTWMEKFISWVGLGSEVLPDKLMHAVNAGVCFLSS